VERDLGRIWHTHSLVSLASFYQLCMENARSTRCSVLKKRSTVQRNGAKHISRLLRKDARENQANTTARKHRGAGAPGLRRKCRTCTRLYECLSSLRPSLQESIVPKLTLATSLPLITPTRAVLNSIRPSSLSAVCASNIRCVIPKHRSLALITKTRSTSRIRRHQMCRSQRQSSQTPQQLQLQ
jgi:hypothetical protein